MARFDESPLFSRVWRKLRANYRRVIWEIRAYTTRGQVTPNYVRKHPNRWSVKVAKKENGLIEFMIVRTLPQPSPMWQGTHLVVHHAGKVIAESNSLVFGHKQDYFFQFALSPEDLAKSRFEFVEGYSTWSADDAMGYPNLRDRRVFPILRGPDLYQFRLLDFVPEGLRKTGGGKQVKLREPGSCVQQVENGIRTKGPGGGFRFTVGRPEIDVEVMGCSCSALSRPA
jgi:hypothetical protein